MSKPHQARPPGGGPTERAAGPDELERETVRWIAELAIGGFVGGDPRRIGEVGGVLRCAWGRLDRLATDPLGQHMLHYAVAVLEPFATASDRSLLMIWRGLLRHEAGVWPDPADDRNGWEAACRRHAGYVRDIAVHPVVGPAGMLVKLMLLRRATVLGPTGVEGRAVDSLVEAVLRLPFPEEIPCRPSASSW